MSPRNSAQNEAQRAQTRQQILLAGLKAFAEKGYAAASMSYIAKEAGISKGLSYHYFTNKEDLLHGIFEMLLEMGKGMESMFKDLPAKEKLKTTVDLSFRFVKEQSDTMRFMTSLAIQPDVTQKLKEDIARHKQTSIQVYIDIFSELQYPNPKAEAYAFGALIDGAGLGYLALSEDYPLEEMHQKILNKYQL